MITPDRHGLVVARRVAGYHIGDSSWADLIIRAYLNPEQAEVELYDEMGCGDEIEIYEDNNIDIQWDTREELEDQSRNPL